MRRWASTQGSANRTLPGTKKNDSVWMPCISPHEVGHTSIFRIPLNANSRRSGKLGEGGPEGKRSWIPNVPARGPAGYFCGAEGGAAPQHLQRDPRSRSSGEARAPPGCAGLLRPLSPPTSPGCLLRDDKSIRPHEQSFTGRRSPRTPREHHQSCACPPGAQSCGVNKAPVRPAPRSPRASAAPGPPRPASPRSGRWRRALCA